VLPECKGDCEVEIIGTDAYSSLIGCADSLLNEKGELVGIAVAFPFGEGVRPVQSWLDISEIRTFLKEKGVQLTGADTPEVAPQPRAAVPLACP
jgi:hypothetical protein